MPPRIFELRRHVLKKNDELAADLRRRFLAARLPVINLVSGPGTGKTAWLEKTLTELRARGQNPAALVGDPETDYDAQRLLRSGAPVRQITTRGVCHLDADMVAKQLDGWDLHAFDFLFIENVGNLVCTASYDLGESLRVACLSVTEGEDKPAKYPSLFNSADLALVTKMDLAQACDFNAAAARRFLNDVRPGIPLIETSAKTGLGMEPWLDLLARHRDTFKNPATNNSEGI